MPTHVKVAGVWRECSAVHVKRSSVWSEAEPHVRTGGSWETAGSPLAVTPLSTVLFAYGTTVTFTATGGTGSYAWTQVSGPTLTINSPSSAATTFTWGSPTGTGTAVMRVTSGGQTFDVNVVCTTI